MAKYVGYKRPKDTKKTVKHLLTYLGHYKWAFLLIAILVFIRAGQYERPYHGCVWNGCNVCVWRTVNAWLQQAYGAYFPEGGK